MSENKPLSVRIANLEFEDFYTHEPYTQSLVDEVAALEKRLAESESWRGMIDKFVIAIMDELRCGKACGGIDGDQNDPDSTTQVVLQAIRDSWQAAIDAALESVKECFESAIQHRIASGDLYLVGRNDAFRDAVDFIESRIGHNPRAEAQGGRPMQSMRDK